MKQYIKNILKKIIRKSLGQKVIINDVTTYESPYVGLTFLKPITCSVVDDSFIGKNIDLKFTVVVPVKNEEKDLPVFIDSLRKQSLQPDEIIFIDHDSNDSTLEQLRIFAKESQFTKVKIIHAKDSPLFKRTERSSIAGNRNYGVLESSNEIILFTDVGNEMPVHYFRALIGPIWEDPEVDLVGGIYRTQSKKLDSFLTYNWDDCDWNTFLPACRGQVVKKTIYRACNGQPEFLTFAGEDAFYDFFYRKLSRKWVFNKAAQIVWFAPETAVGVEKKFFMYGVGAGEAGLAEAGCYIKEVNLRGRKSPSKILSTLPIDAPLFLGHMVGKACRGEIDQRRNVNDLVFFVIHNPLFMSRSSRLYIERLTKEGKRVICITVDHVWKGEPAEVYLDCDFSLLENYFEKDFAVTDIFTRYHTHIRYSKISYLQDIENSSAQTKSLLKWLEQMIDTIRAEKI